MYEEPVNAETHPDINTYIKYIGFCGKECWDKLSDRGKNVLLFRAMLEGDKSKRDKVPVSKVHYKKEEKE
tara:strand:- start:521 stop:730 length:210 start_codon:yes stop_codon:yes gene_type:complete